METLLGSTKTLDGLKQMKNKKLKRFIHPCEGLAIGSLVRPTEGYETDEERPYGIILRFEDFNETDRGSLESLEMAHSSRMMEQEPDQELWNSSQKRKVTHALVHWSQSFFFYQRTKLTERNGGWKSLIPVNALEAAPRIEVRHAQPTKENIKNDQ